MENKWKIITELVESNWLLKQCFFITKNIEKAEFYQSEIILKLYDLEKLENLYKKNEHKKYISKMIFNQIFNKHMLKYEIENTINFEEYYFKNED